LASHLGHCIVAGLPHARQALADDSVDIRKEKEVVKKKKKKRKKKKKKRRRTVCAPHKNSLQDACCGQMEHIIYSRFIDVVSDKRVVDRAAALHRRDQEHGRAAANAHADFARLASQPRRVLGIWGEGAEREKNEIGERERDKERPVGKSE
jgi:hypothetical protein